MISLTWHKAQQKIVGTLSFILKSMKYLHPTKTSLTQLIYLFIVIKSLAHPKKNYYYYIYIKKKKAWKKSPTQLFSKSNVIIILVSSMGWLAFWPKKVAEQSSLFAIPTWLEHRVNSLQKTTKLTKIGQNLKAFFFIQSKFQYLLSIFWALLLCGAICWNVPF